MKKQITVFTDGSCPRVPGPGGWAFAILEADRLLWSEAGAAADQTNNTMELQAAIEAMRWLIREQHRDCDITVFSDSQYLVNGVTGWRHAWKRNGWRRKENGRLMPLQNVRHWKLIDGLCNEFSSLRFEWVRGHAGNQYNELVDRMAGQAVWDLIERGV